jgi:hypothetical protein
METAFYSAIGQTEVLDAASAARSVVEECDRQLQGRKPAAAILYASYNLDHQTILDTILGAWPGIHLVGCTTDGEFSSLKGYTQDSILLVALGSNSVEFASGLVDTSDGPGAPYRTALEAACAKTVQSPTIGLVFTNGLTFNGEDAIHGLSDVLGQRVPLFGGTAADGWSFKGTRQFHGNRILDNAATFLLFCGSFRYAYSVRTGWKSIGRVGVVTRATRNVVYEIDGKPAIDFYHELMGEAATPSVETPTAVYDQEDQYQFLRTSLKATDPETGAITYFASIPEGSRVRLTLVNRDSIVSGTEQSVREALQSFGGSEPPSLALCTSCAARRVILGTRTVDECHAVQKILGDGVPVAGFYSFGEFSPPSSQTATQFHNESFVTLLLG